MGVCYLLWRFHRSPVGSVLVAIRENEQRAPLHRLSDQPLQAHRLRAVRHGRRRSPARCRCSTIASPRPSRLSVAFSGELSPWWSSAGCAASSGPALGALFFILFREFLSIWTPHWLFWFGLLFVGFIVFSPTGLVGVAERADRAVPPARGRGGGHGRPHRRRSGAAAAVLSPLAPRATAPVLVGDGPGQALRRHPCGRRRRRSPCATAPCTR